MEEKTTLLQRTFLIEWKMEESEGEESPPNKPKPKRFMPVSMLRFLLLSILLCLLNGLFGVFNSEDRATFCYMISSRSTTGGENLHTLWG